jgi:heme exporter protein A
VKGGSRLPDEAAALDARLTVAHALGFWARLDGGAGSGRDGADGARSARRRAGADALHRQRKRATLARVIASGRPVWLLDEPAKA